MLCVLRQSAMAVNHLTVLLNARGLPSVKIVSGMGDADRRGAVDAFVKSPTTRCFVLHAGQAAAGLTLTVASTVVLLEPFLSAGDEAQAMNRCHRIGQTQQVNCITLYTPGTVEERLLAYRPRERAFGSGGAAPSPLEEAGAPDDDTALSMLGAVEGGGGSGSGRGGGEDACSLAKLTFLLGLRADDMMVGGPLDPIVLE